MNGMTKEPFLDDTKKFAWLAWILTGIVLLALAANILQDTFLAGAGEYIQRRLYYEQAIFPEGLSLHEGKYWKEKK